MNFDSEFDGKKFLKLTVLATLAGILITVGIHVWLDIYGLFRPVKGRSIPVYHAERTSKYLLSYRYIPQNFNTLIVGTSLSDNLDITPYNQKNSPLRIYNASIMGANISEINPIVENALKGDVKNIIICISPYLTKNSGAKEVEFGPKLYAGALGSKNLYETYVVGLIREFELMPGKFPRNQINEFGVNHYAAKFQVDNVKEKIAEVIEENKNEQLNIDSTALQQFRDLIRLLDDRKINYLGYFHPVPKEILESKKETYDTFQREIRKIIRDDNRLIDFNAPSYESFTSDYSNYIDHGHLSDKGQKIITETLYNRMTASIAVNR